MKCGLAVVSLFAAGVMAFAESPQVIYKAQPKYPPEAKLAQLQGTVVLEVSVNARGVVQDARVTSGPAELRRAALEAVLQWQFESVGNPFVTQITINFTLDSTKPAATPVGNLRGVEFENVNEVTKKRILARMPIQAGDPINSDNLSALQTITAEIDRSVRVSLSEDLTLRFDATPAIRVGGNVQATKLVNQVRPEYPALAKQSRIQGVVRLNCTIDRAGRVVNVELVSGHPLLVPAAVDAVKQWQYEKTLLNGQPVAVITQVDVNFTLAP